MPIVGDGVRDPNFRLRFFAIIFIGLIGFGIAMSWRSQILFAAEYQDMPVTHQQIKIRKQNIIKKTLMEKQRQSAQMQTEE